MIQWLDSSEAGFNESLAKLLQYPAADHAAVRETVARILADVRARGDDVVVELTNKFDQQSAKNLIDLQFEPAELKSAFDALSSDIQSALQLAADRVRTYHEHQVKSAGGDWDYVDEDGNRMGQRVRPMRRLGIYAPGGKAAYPSTIIMTAVPARVAGVEEIVLCVPAPGGEINQVVLAAAWLAGVDRVFSIGGAQAIGAMAYGTQTIPRVDKIVGPGNIYVATAKEMVFGDVGIDMIAGPSEVVIIADESAPSDWIVRDMLAQAEHDEWAQSIVVSADEKLLREVQALLPEMVKNEPRSEIIAASIKNRGGLILAASLEDAISISNRIAPEHLQLAIKDPAAKLDQVRHAGAIFLGPGTAEVVGDYTAGPSHVLPTSGTARFASPLGVYDFLTRSSIIDCSDTGLVRLNGAAAILADEEGLSAHAASARARLTGQEK